MKHQSDKHDNQLQYNKIKTNHEHICRYLAKNGIILYYVNLDFRIDA